MNPGHEEKKIEKSMRSKQKNIVRESHGDQTRRDLLDRPWRTQRFKTFQEAFKDVQNSNT